MKSAGEEKIAETQKRRVEIDGASHTENEEGSLRDEDCDRMKRWTCSMRTTKQVPTKILESATVGGDPKGFTTTARLLVGLVEHGKNRNNTTYPVAL